MKTTLHLILAALGLATFDLCTAVVQAQDYTYTTNNGTITITRYIGSGGAVEVPSIIKGLPVTSIGMQAFWRCDSLTRITIANSVTSIEDNSFGYCNSLTNVTIGNHVTRIGNWAFENCKSLTRVTIPDNVTSIGVGSFGSCMNLVEITMASNGFYYSVDGVLYRGYAPQDASGTLTQCPGGKAGIFLIPKGVPTIEDYAFVGCTKLTSVNIPSGLFLMGFAPFTDCTSLMAITVDPMNSYYSSIDGVLFDKTMTGLVQFPGGISGSYTIPNNVNHFAEGAFFHCTGLTNITIPSSVTNIHAFVFGGCSGLTSITIPNRVTSIGHMAFRDCPNLQKVYFSGNAPTVGLDLFWQTPALIYYLAGTSGWGATFGDRPTALWSLPNPLILNNDPSVGVLTNAFGFHISWATNASVVVETSTRLDNPTWSTLSTNTLTDGSSYFSDPQWTNYPKRFYRVRSQ